MPNHLHYGDNLTVLRDSIASESVDLIYLDPPFNSNAGYNVLFKAPDGSGSAAQIEAFDDTWHWNDSAEAAFADVLRSGNSAAAEMLRAMRGFLGENDMMAYLAMMDARLIELHRVLKPTGSLYLHCDPTASHYREARFYERNSLATHQHKSACFHALLFVARRNSVLSQGRTRDMERAVSSPLRKLHQVPLRQYRRGHRTPIHSRRLHQPKPRPTEPELRMARSNEGLEVDSGTHAADA